MYKIQKLTLKERIEIPVGAVVELEVNEVIDIPFTEISCSDGDYLFTKEFNNYGTFHIRKSIAKKGVLQCISTPFPEGYYGKPTIVVQNNHVAPIELLKGEEIGSVWIFTQ